MAQPLIRKLASVRLAGLAIALAGSGATPAMAGTTYFVRISGDNANSGTSPATAWKTIDHAANKIKAGDIAYVGAGTYNEQITPNNDGASAAPVQYIADVTGSKTGDAGKVVIQAPNARTAISIGSDAYAEFVGFEIIGSTGRDAVKWTNSPGGALTNCIIHDSPKHGINIDGSDVNITNCLIYNAGDDGINIADSSTKFSHVVVSGTTIHDTGDDGIDIYQNSTLTVTGCTIYNIPDDAIGIDDDSSVVTVHETVIHNALDGIWIGNTSTVTVVNCLFYALTEQAIEVENYKSTVATVWNCTMSTTGVDAVWIKGGTLSVTNCILANNSGTGIRKTGGTLTHTYNVVFGNPGGNFVGTTFATGETTSDPKFVSNGSDFHLQATSPAVNTGANASAFTVIDLAGGARPTGGGWDIGCYEYGTAAVHHKITSWAQVAP